MKFHFTAIDSRGAVMRGVLRAENEDDARDLLLSEDIFAKQLEPAPEDEKVTWSAKGRVKKRLADAATWNQQKAQENEEPVAAVFETLALTGYDAPVRGRAGLAESGAFVFQPLLEGKERLHLGPADLETVSVSGYPGRVLRLTLVSGRMYEFAAGFFLTRAGAREIQRRLKKEL
jgi:hypothetical protein